MWLPLQTSCDVKTVLLGGLYKGTQAPQGAAGSAYDAMSGAKIKILGEGNKKN